MKTLLLNDTHDWYHWGCTATSYAVRKRLIQHDGPITIVPIYATRKLADLPVELEQFDDPAVFRRFAGANRKLVDLLAGHDRVVVNGEGSIHDLSHTSVGLLYLAYACKRFLDTPVCVINHSAYPVAHGDDHADLARAMYLKVYACLDDVAIRECVSFDAIRALGIQARLTFDCLPITVKEGFKKPVSRRDTIVVADGVNMPMDAMPALAGAMDHWRDKGFTVEMLMGAKANPAPESEWLTRALKTHMKRTLTIRRAESLKSWLTTIAEAKLLVSGRFHHSIAAAFLGTPFVVFESNTPKNSALCRELDLELPLSWQIEGLRDVLIDRGERVMGSRQVPEHVLDALHTRAERNFDGL